MIIVTDLQKKDIKYKLFEKSGQRRQQKVPSGSQSIREHRPGTVPLTTGAKAIIEKKEE
ncbi:MAG: hypothetical protein ACLUOI_23105 [Eisenbergiella sp.]